MIDPSAYPSLSTQESEIVKQIYSFTQRYFQNPKFDASHDFDHVLRVTSNAIRILEMEQPKRMSSAGQQLQPYSAFTVILGALLHDVEDKKYVVHNDTTSSTAGFACKNALLQAGVSASYAEVVQKVVDGVSYSSEIKDPGHVRELIDEIPELAIVQDADRLDAIGAIGIGRCFTFGGAKSTRSLEDTLDHFKVKLLKLEGMMKTETGKLMAQERSRRLRQFMSWWQDETSG